MWRQLELSVRKTRLRDLFEQSFSEIIPAADFWRIADDVGHLLTPPDWIKEKWRTHHLITHGVGSGSEKFWEHPLTAMLQHHGVPTRFLDWTLHPLVAAYFAAEGADSGSGHMAVWALNRDGLKRCDRLRSIRFLATCCPFCMHNQVVFVWNTNATPFFALNGEWPAQEAVVAEMEREFAGTRPTKPWLFKITVPKSEGNDILALLWRARISKAHLMPTLDNAAHEYWRATKWQSADAWFD